MKRKTWSLLIVASVLAFAPMTHAGTKSYQVTGPIVELKDSVVVQKGKEHWQIARDADTKVRGDLQVGDGDVDVQDDRQRDPGKIDPARPLRLWIIAVAAAVGLTSKGLANYNLFPSTVSPKELDSLGSKPVVIFHDPTLLGTLPLANQPAPLYNQK